MKSILLFSGGIDSYIAYCYLQNRACGTEIITPMYFNYNGDNSTREEQTAIKLLPFTTVISNVFNLHKSQSHDTHNTLFGRNLYFCIYAAQFTDKHIYLCGLKNSDMLDNTNKFYQKSSKVLTQITGKNIKVSSPFAYLEKEEIVKWYLTKYPKNITTLLQTTSCYRPTKHYCGKCLNCFYLYCSLFRYTKQLDFTNTEIIKNEIKAALMGERKKERTKSIKIIAKAKGLL